MYFTQLCFYRPELVLNSIILKVLTGYPVASTLDESKKGASWVSPLTLVEKTRHKYKITDMALTDADVQKQVIFTFLVVLPSLLSLTPL